MTQKQANSPAAGASESKDEKQAASGKTLETKLGSTGDALLPDRGLGREALATRSQKRPSLVERLRAEQLRTPPETKVEETGDTKGAKEKTKDLRDLKDLKTLKDLKGTKPTEFGEASESTPRPITRTRRLAGPARRLPHAHPANDDLPSIGGLIFALQQRPTGTPFLVALLFSAVWFLVGGFFAFRLVSSNLAPDSGTVDLLANPTALVAAVAILVPIAIFWFLALLVWRAQELRLMASAMTEVAVRLAEPDKLAEQSVASLGQTIRRQVAAMNDAISRAIGRASELETLVHNEVAALERSYGDNELRVRNLIGELASEREALTNNSERVSKALKGVGAQVTRDISAVSGSIDKKLAERGKQLTELLVARTNEAAEQVQKAQNKVAEHVPALIDRLGKEQTRLSQVIESAAKNLSSLENVVGERTNTLDRTLKERTEALQSTLGARIKALHATVSQGALTLDKTLKTRTEAFTAAIGASTASLDKSMKDRTDAFVASIGQGANVLNKALTDRTQSFTAAVDQSATSLNKTLQDRTDAFVATIHQGATALDKTLAARTEGFADSMAERGQAVIASLAERLQHIDAAFGRSTGEIDRVLAEHTRLAHETFGQQTAQLNQMLTDNSAMIRQTAEQVGGQSKEAVTVLTNQTQTLRDVSRGLLEQIHNLTQRFENQGQAILTAAKALDSSNTKIDSILEGRHEAIVGLLQTVTTKAQDLDNMMRSYAGTLDGAMGQAEARAKQMSSTLARDTAGQAQQALAQIERLREEAQAHTQRAVGDLKTSFETVITQIGRQLDQMRGQFDSTSQGVREAARQTVSELDGMRQDMHRRMESLPQQTTQATAAIRTALSEQMREIDTITPLLSRAAGGNGADPYRQPAQPVQNYDVAPRPQFDARGRQMPGSMGEPQDVGSVASSLAQQLASASSRTPESGQSDRRHDDWSVGNVLARASETGDRGYGGPSGGPAPMGGMGGGGGFRFDELAYAIDHRTAAEVWQRFRAGERGVLGRHIYTAEGQATFDDISRRYNREGDFRMAADRYVGDFERLLREAEQTDPEGRTVQTYLTSETGRVYLLLAHASGRLQ